WRHVAVQDHVVDRQCAFFDIPVADEMEGAVLPGTMATGTILVNQRRNVLVERHFSRAGQQGPKE
ncbi:MAG: hypothetical protein CMN04_09905, partial [Roseibacillus sp.]|nr:hypothetical protein [Roseibacillus sp.]